MMRSVYLTLAIIAAILLGVGGFAAYREFSPPSSPFHPSPTPQPLTQWKQYNNSDYEFSIEYPPTTTVQSIELAQYREFGIRIELPDPSISPIVPRVSIQVVGRKKTTYDKLAQSFQRHDRRWLNDPSHPLTQLSSELLGGNAAAHTSQIQCNPTGQYCEKTDFFFLDNERFNFLITSTYVVDETRQVLSKNLADQILSTFTFTNPQLSSDNETDTNSWATYAGINFSFRYPLTWKKQDNTITGGTPDIQIDLSDEYPNMMNECAREMAPISKNGFVIRNFTAITNGELCSVMNGDERQMWFVQTADSYGPGITISYSATDSQAQQMIDRIAESFSFNK